MDEVKKIKPAHEDERGKIFDIVDGIDFVHAGLITFKPGVVRANHYHKQTEQLNYILNGKIKYRSKDLKNTDSVVEEVILEAGDMIESGIMEWHSLEALEDSTLLFFTKKARESGGYEEDNFKIPMEKIESFKLE